ncbi:MAG: HAMP domain-containing histidine kinase [Defluviitaleaceae bacterium]|nr:HAMP domain-containing histidine kinase [Defluviitaleaceae bacterium]
MFKLKRATQYTLFATGLMIFSIFILYLMLIGDISAHLRGMGLNPAEYTFIGERHLLIFIVAAAIAFTVSSVIIENVLNPLRQMISKVNEIAEMKFDKPLIIDEEDDELREYALAFNTMAAKLNRYIEMQKRFVSDASHELATPITVINGHADMLLRRGHNRESLETIKEEIMRMNGLVDSLLLLARSDNAEQSYNFEKTDVERLLQESIEEMQLVAPDFIFQISTDDNLSSVEIDAYAIRRVMRILLTNAVKYSGEEKTIKITVAQNHGKTEISVKDHGIGIPKEHLPRIFERFYRVDPSRNRKTGSNGLGLAIAQEIITAHGGEIHAESDGKGTEIKFCLPLYCPCTKI